LVASGTNLLKALSERKKEGKLSQQELAKKLDVHRSLINPADCPEKPI
jgi:transcriptional regulator with XRE-family HTH domain